MLPNSPIDVNKVVYVTSHDGVLQKTVTSNVSIYSVRNN